MIDIVTINRGLQSAYAHIANMNGDGGDNFECQCINGALNYINEKRCKTCENYIPHSAYPAIADRGRCILHHCEHFENYFCADWEVEG